jgi:hexosaminidase
VRFADQRGIAVIPELETPGHANSMAQAMPELFGSLNEQGKPRPLGGCLNMANEAVYPALETIVKEMCDVFNTSPYFHIGADEVWLEQIKEIPEWKQYKQSHGIESDHDVYYHSITRMHEIVKRQGRKTLVW